MHRLQARRRPQDAVKASGKVSATSPVSHSSYSLSRTSAGLALGSCKRLTGLAGVSQSDREFLEAMLITSVYVGSLIFVP